MARLRLFALGLLFLYPLVGRAQIELSSAAKISVLTCSEGPELHAAFGHSALRVFDPGNGIDQVYNFGTFDFDAPNFYLNFVKGKLDYFVSISSYNAFSGYYKYVGRSVVSQELILSTTQKQQIFNTLVFNAKPENKYYRYDFLTENCATKIPEILMVSLGDSLVIGSLYDSQDLTYRSTIHEHLSRFSWERFGIDLVLGARVDQPIKGAALAYLPVYLKELLAQSSFYGQPIVRETRLETPKAYELQEASFIYSPLLVVSLILFYAIVSLWLGKTKQGYAFFDQLILLIMGSVGMLLTFLNFFAEHYATALNFSIFWANPLLIIALFFRSKTLLQAVAMLSILTIPLALFGVQYFSVEIMLCALLTVLLTIKRGIFTIHPSVTL
ncbi:MAG: DUF4105 domain-containing protein [Bacteroidetes bacterium]|nr:DUF4105 domain-containing protein [Bacteroidota bacterium]